MAQIDPKMKARVASLSQALQEEVKKQDMPIHTLNDLIQCLEKIAAEK